MVCDRAKRGWSGAGARGNEMCPFGVPADLGPRLTASAADRGKYRDIVIFAIAGPLGKVLGNLWFEWGWSVDNKAAVEFRGVRGDLGAKFPVCKHLF